MELKLKTSLTFLDGTLSILLKKSLISCTKHVHLELMNILPCSWQSNQYITLYMPFLQKYLAMFSSNTCLVTISAVNVKQLYRKVWLTLCCDTFTLWVVLKLSNYATLVVMLLCRYHGFQLIIIGRSTCWQIMVSQSLYFHFLCF